MTNMPNNPREGTVYEEVIVVSDDEESYIEEIIESDEYIEEFIEEVVDSDSFGSEECLDDDSSAPPASIDSDAPVNGEELGWSYLQDTGVDRLTKRRASIHMEIQNAAVSEGARKAMEEELARQRSHRRLKQEPVVHQQDTLERQRQQDEAARRRLTEDMRKIDVALSKKREAVAKTRMRGAAEVEKRKKALAELRRRAAREELAQHNATLKASKATRVGSC